MSCPVVIGGIISELNGGSFSQGAIIAAASAAMSIGLNSLQSDERSVGRTKGTGADDIDRRGKNSLTVSKEIMEILFMAKDFAQQAQKFFESTGRTLVITIKDDVKAITQKLFDACTSGCARATDFVTTGLKFEHDPLHIRIYDNRITFHLDQYNINVAPVRHILVDTFGNWLHGGGW